jgi:NADH-ubiquinone oxidoreductase chain 1
VSPTQANFILFFLGPIVTLIFSLFGYAVIPYGPGLAISDSNLGILYMLAVSSLSTYGILLAGWAANSKYSFLGSLRSTAQLISYELILSSALLIVIMFTGSLSLTVIVEAQKYIWFILPLFPVFIIFFIGALAETNRAPMDLAEAESELVSGFMTEHSAAIFVFFFLAEYASIVLISILMSVLFLGGYLLPFHSMFSLDNIILEGAISGLSLGFKSCLFIFLFIWVRASFPRIRYDQLMQFCWTVLLPLVFAFIFLVVCVIVAFDAVPTNISLLFFPGFILCNKNPGLNNVRPKPTRFT